MPFWVLAGKEKNEKGIQAHRLRIALHLWDKDHDAF